MPTMNKVISVRPRKETSALVSAQKLMLQYDLKTLVIVVKKVKVFTALSAKGCFFQSVNGSKSTKV